DHTAFGTASLGGPGVVRTFTVRNDGTGELTLNGPTLPAGFTLIEPLVSSLAPGQSDTFQVQLDTLTTGAKSGQIVILSNDADEATFNFSVSGTVGPGLAPEITVLGNGVSIADGDTTPAGADHTGFGMTPQGGPPIVRTFTVRND